jgi:dTDP-4-dehydrorhamnose 3,5-epimerase-like enzyme
VAFPAQLIDITTHGGDDGQLGVLESKRSVPFEIKRVYYLYSVPTESMRGAHAHKELEQLIIPLSGSLEVTLDSGSEKQTFLLADPSQALHVQPGLWRDLHNFSEHAVALILASEFYDESDYIRNYDEFLLWAGK